MKNKKGLLLALLLCVCFLFAGCNSVGTVGLIQNANGTITEFYIIPYMESELIANGLTIAESTKIKALAKENLDSTFETYINEYKARIDANTSYSESEKESLKNGITINNSFINKTEQNYTIGLDGSITPNDYITYIRYELYFANSTCYTEFKNSNEAIKEDKEVVIQSNLFTTTTKVVKDPVFDKIQSETLTLSNYIVGYIKSMIINVMAGDNPTAEKRAEAIARWNTISINTSFNYVSDYFNYYYIVPTARIKSNAKQVTYQDGYYYHMWQLKSDNSILPEDEQIHFEYWSTSANKVTWYIIATLGAVAIMLPIYFISRKKEKEEINKILES